MIIEMMCISKDIEHINGATANEQPVQNLNNNFAMDEVSALLIAWNLPQLCDIFQKEEVCINALMHLTDNDINELIPKIGPRAIFREQLKKWKDEQKPRRQQQQTEKVQQPKKQILENRRNVVRLEHLFLNNENYQKDEKNIQLEPKTKSKENKIINLTVDDIEMEIKEETPEDIDQISLSSEATSNFENIELPTAVLEDIELATENTADQTRSNLENIEKKYNNNKRDYNNDDDDENENEQNCENQSANGGILNVFNVLNHCEDGRIALKAFSKYGSLNAKNRRFCVKAIINAAVEINPYLKAEQFKDLAEQFVQIFPCEKVADYFIPRHGTYCPRGALYNRYINLSRHLRLSGKIKYRNNVNTRNRIRILSETI